MDNHSILVTGGTGYVGGRLIPRLLNEGYRVRAMVRSPQRLAAGSVPVTILRAAMILGSGSASFEMLR